MTNIRFYNGMDAIRVGACFLVVLLHVAAVEFHSFDGQWAASNFYDAFSRSCVPLFLMISGALLLDKREAFTVFLRKRAMRVVPPLAFWSLFYMVWKAWQGESYGNLLQWLIYPLSGPVAFHLWYLYAIVGIYLFVPFLRHIWHASGLLEKHLFLGLWMAASAWPLVQEVFNLDVDVLDTWQIGYFFGYAGYLFLGAYIREVGHPWLTAARGRWRHAVLAAVLFVVFSTLTMEATFLYSVYLGEPSALFYDYLSPLVVGASVCLFYLLCRAGASLRQPSAILGRYATGAFGVYCLHIFVLDIVRMIVGLPESGPSSWWTIPVTAILVFGISMAVVLIFRRVPFVRYVA